MSTRKADEPAAPAPRKSSRPASQPGEVIALQAEYVGGVASPAKAAVGDTPVFAYISSLPQPQRGIAERIDQLAARTLPGL